MAKRAAGEGNLRKRKDGLWGGRYYVTKPTGERVRREVYGKSQAEARAKLKDAIAQAERGIMPDNPTLGEYLGRWIEAKDGSASFTTTRRYRHIIVDHLVPALGRIQLKRLTLLDVNSMLKARAATLAPRTVHHLRAVLRNALNDAVAAGLIERNVADLRVWLPKLEPAKPNFLEAHEAEAVFRAAEGDDLEAVFAVLALGLAPPSEVLGLRWRDVELDGDRPTLTVRHGLHRKYGTGLVLKGLKSDARHRELRLPAFAAEALRRHKAKQSAQQLRALEWLAGPDGDFVFTTKHGTPLNPDDLRDYVYRVLGQAGLKGRITLYGFRHTAASLLYAQTRDWKLVAATLGHSNIAMAQKTYVHLMGGSDDRAADALDRAYHTGG